MRTLDGWHDHLEAGLLLDKVWQGGPARDRVRVLDRLVQLARGDV
jgi:hypothetical protein